MKRIDWNRLVPLGVSGVKIRNQAIGCWFLGVLWSLSFFTSYISAYSKLYTRVGREKIWLPDAVMKPFVNILGGSLVPLYFMGLAMPVIWIIEFTLRHYQGGSRSIYTMRRLKSSWELWRRVLAMPLLLAAACALTALALRGLYYGCYIWFTPAAYLPY